MTASTADTVQAHRRRGRAREHRLRVTPTIVGSYVLIGLYSLTLLLPLYWLLISSFKNRVSAVASPLTPGFDSGLSHYREVWNQLGLGSALVNSAYITVGSMVLDVVLAIPAAYALARAGGKVAALIERIYSLGFLIPAFAALVPTLLLAIHIGLFNTREFMILYMAAAGQPLAVILLTQFMRTVPKEIEESATVDGASRLRILRSVYLPLTMPGVAMVAILHFISAWNEYLFTLVITGTNIHQRTVQVALPLLQDARGVVDYSVLAAGTVISVLPVFLVYAILNRRMEDALVQGAVKG